MSLGTAVVAFAAGFVSVLVFHQGVWALYGAAGKAPGPAWNMAAAPPLGVPMVISSAFWAGCGALCCLAAADRRAIHGILAGDHHTWWTATSIVALMVVSPLKGRPFAGGWKPEVWAFALSVNAAWAFGTGLLLRVFGAG